MTLAQFDALYAHRHQPEALRECAAILDHLPEEWQWLWRGARLSHFQAMQASETGDERAARAAFERGAELARRAEASEGESAPPLFWRATCELEAARRGGALSLARVVSGAQKRLERAAFLDEAHHEAGPLRVLGRLIHLRPLVLGGSLDRALSFYGRALQIAPTNPTTQLYRADALLADNQPVEARRALEKLLNEPTSPDWQWEAQRDRALAKQWLETRFS